MSSSLRWLALPLFAVLAGSSSSNSHHEAPVIRTVGRPGVVTEIHGVERWRRETRYLLRGPVIVTAGGELVIEAGTRIEGQPGASLAVSRDARIMAIGTLLQPIVMTCNAPTKSVGCWDGVVINGYAPINIGTATSPAPRGGSGTEGCLETGDEQGSFGGCESSDSSGVFRYVRVEYATDGVRLRGVGKKTLVEYIEVLRTWGDGLGITGGTVNVSHGVLSASGNAGLAWRNGWVGAAQFLLVQQDPANFRSAIRGENDAANPDAAPRSAPSIYNSTILAASSPTNPYAGLPARAIWLTGGTAGYLRNLIVHRARVALDVDGEATCQQIASGALAVTNSAFTGATQLGDDDADPSGCSAEDAIITNAANANLVLTTPAQVDSVFFDDESLTLPDLRLRFARPVSAGVNLATPPSGGFFDVSATYYGAIPPITIGILSGTIPWYAGWTVGAPLAEPAQAGILAGSVSAVGFGPLAGVSISVQGGASGATNGSGTYSFAVSPGVLTLTVGNLPSECAAVQPAEITVRPGETVSHTVMLDCTPAARLVAAGGLHSCAISSGAWCWGTNGYGGVGDGTTTQRTSPVPLTPGPTFTQVTTGSQHSCGLTAAGEAWCWGLNNSGQIGDGTTTDRHSPTAVAGGLTFARIAAGAEHTCGLTTSDVVFCWGKGTSGQLGAGPGVSSSLSPIRTAASPDFRDLTTGSNHTCALTPDGHAYCWGANESGQLGITTTAARNTPTAVFGDLIFTNISAGGSHTCGASTIGDAYCWGLNTNGQLGDGTLVPHLTPARVSGTITFRDIEAGGSHTCAISVSGGVLCWGFNGSGQLGDGTLTRRLTPAAVLGGLTFRQISAGTAHTCGSTTSGAIACWGNDYGAQVGQGGGGFRQQPTPVAGGLSFVSVTAGNYHSCGITPAGFGYCWGSNGSGQLGIGSSEPERTAPTLISGSHHFTKLAAGVFHTCGIDVGGAAFCWGSGALGTGGGASNSPQAVSGGLTFTDIAVGQNHTCGIASDGFAYCWGANSDGQVGVVTPGTYAVPTRVAGETMFAKIGVGWFHSCALTSAGTAHCWGSNQNGQLGNGTRDSSFVPTPVSGSFAFSSIDGGYQHTCALTTTNQAVCWGWDGFGQLGDGTPGGYVPTPTVVPGGYEFIRLTAGSQHNCGMAVAIGLLCWGDNAFFQVGDGTSVQRASPVAVVGGGTYPTVAAGLQHTCGMVGIPVCWGSNQTSQIGDGKASNVTAPVIISLGGGPSPNRRPR